jgi:RNA ligase
MEMEKKYDLNIIKEYIDAGLIEKNNHPVYPISIYNYSRDCQFEKKWDNITLNMRGTILDAQGNLLARTFPKFFNMEEMGSIPNETFDVFEKMDGSLGILFHYEDEWILATKGSFTSDQALKGFEMLKSYDYQKLHKDYTYLFEIIYEENRIVCQYDFEDLVLLGMIENKTGYEVDLYEDGNDIRLKNLIENIGFKIVKKYYGIEDYRNLKNLIDNNHEGFVLRFESRLRMKIKGDEYVRLHKLLTNFSNVDIWESLMLGKDLTLMLEKVPDEFDSWVRNTIEDLKIKFKVREDRANEILEETITGKGLTRKEIAEILNTQTSMNKAIIFCMLDGKDYSEIIWKNIRPVYQKPFWQKED